MKVHLAILPVLLAQGPAQFNDTLVPVHDPAITRLGRGVPINPGGGRTAHEENKDWNGVGDNGVAALHGIDYLLFHGYDAADNGRSK